MRSYREREFITPAISARTPYHSTTALPNNSWAADDTPAHFDGDSTQETARLAALIWEMGLYPDIAVDLNVLKPRSVVTRLIGTVADFSRKRADGMIALGDDMKARLVARGIPEHKILVAEDWGDECEIPAPFEEGDGVLCAIDAQGREEYQLSSPDQERGVELFLDELKELWLPEPLQQLVHTLPLLHHAVDKWIS